MNTISRAVIVGATSGIAVAFAELLAKEKTDIVLVGRKRPRLDEVARHLGVLGAKTSIHTVASVDEIRPAWDAIQDGGRIDLLLIAQGMLPGDASSSYEPEVSQTFQANTIEPILWCQSAAPSFEKWGGGCIAVLGSVAGDRGRVKNHIYSAAKSAIETYCEGLRLRLSPRTKVCLVKPGVTKTAMIAGLPPSPLTFPPETVALCALKAIRNGKSVAYAPPIWGLVMSVIKKMPDSLLKASGI